MESNNISGPATKRQVSSRRRSTSVSLTEVKSNTLKKPINSRLERVENGNGQMEEVLTPRSRSPIGLIPSHTNYRYFIHKYEVPRKILHVSIGFLTMGLYYKGVALSQVTPILIFLLVSIVSLDLLRFNSPKFSNIYIKSFGFLMRESEVNKLNGIVYYLLGLIFVFMLFPKDISVLSVFLLSWADTAASTFGRAFGHLTPKFFRNKSLAGSGAAFFTGVIASYLLYAIILPSTPELNVGEAMGWSPETSRLNLFTLCIFSGFIGAAAEAVDICGIDDNLTIPAISATFLSIALKIFQK
ncbi:cytidylyltransferase family-domain-containing protein [Dipodascopsis uninucleata]